MKKAVSLVLALTLALALAVPAWADGFTGIAFSSDAGVLLAQPGYQENRIPGKWSYDEEKQILTLNGVSLNEDIGLIENLISENRTLKIVLNGTNQLGYIDCSCDLVFEGDGSLSLIGSESLRCGSVTINGGTLNVNNIMCSKAHGAAGTFESSGNAIINAGTVIIGSAKSTPAFSDIMRCSNLTLNGGTVNATVVSGYVYCESDFSISEGIINITVKNADNECQIRCANFVQTGGLLNLTFANAFPDNEDAFSGFHCSRFEKKGGKFTTNAPYVIEVDQQFYLALPGKDGLILEDDFYDWEVERAPHDGAPIIPAPAAKPVVQPTTQNLTVNGAAKNTEIYNVDGSNYFKLRDVAMLLNGTSSQFSVDWDEASKTIAVTTGAAYTPVGGELATGTDKSASAVVSAQKLTVDGKAVELTAYNIGGNNFFKLRDLGEALGFNVDWVAETKTMAVTSK